MLPDEIERVGLALMKLEETIHDLARQSGLEPKDLNLNLGPIGPPEVDRRWPRVREGVARRRPAHPDRQMVGEAAPISRHRAHSLRSSRDRSVDRRSPQPPPSSRLNPRRTLQPAQRVDDMRDLSGHHRRSALSQVETDPSFATSSLRRGKPVAPTFATSSLRRRPARSTVTSHRHRRVQPAGTCGRTSRNAPDRHLLPPAYQLEAFDDAGSLVRSRARPRRRTWLNVVPKRIGSTRTAWAATRARCGPVRASTPASNGRALRRSTPATRRPISTARRLEPAASSSRPTQPVEIGRDRRERVDVNEQLETGPYFFRWREHAVGGDEHARPAARTRDRRPRGRARSHRRGRRPCRAGYRRDRAGSHWASRAAPRERSRRCDRSSVVSHGARPVRATAKLYGGHGPVRLTATPVAQQIRGRAGQRLLERRRAAFRQRGMRRRAAGPRRLDRPRGRRHRPARAVPRNAAAASLAMRVAARPARCRASALRAETWCRSSAAAGLAARGA